MPSFRYHPAMPRVSRRGRPRWQSILSRYNLKYGWCYPPISTFWAPARPLERLSVFKLKPAIHTIVRLRIYSFFLILDRFFYECQMVVYIFFQDADCLRNIPDRQGIIFKFIDNFLSYGLFSFIGHRVCPGPPSRLRLLLCAGNF